MILKHIVGQDDDGKTIKHVLKSKLELSERLVKRLKYSSRILCNGTPVHVNFPVKAGDLVEADIEFSEEDNDIQPENIEINIIYEDDCFIILNKQAGIVVHPTFNHPSGTIANAIMHHLNKKGIMKKIRPVSRLDRDTSGIIIFAKNEYVQEALIRQMNKDIFIKEYIGIAGGIVSDKHGTIDLPIDRKPGSIILRYTTPDGYPSVTHYEVIEYLNNATFLKFTLETGRTHQIRVHCQAIGHPLIGDTLYLPEPVISCQSPVSEVPLIDRQALHSCRVSFVHPITKKPISLSAPIPADIKSLLEILRK